MIWPGMAASGYQPVVALLGAAENARTGVVEVPAVVGYGHNAGCVPLTWSVGSGGCQR
jgi:hypothetical protein